MNPAISIILTLLGLGLLATAVYFAGYFGIQWLLNQWK